MAVAVVVLVAFAASGCAALVERREGTQMRPRFAVCPDGRPVKLLVDASCPGGVCGFSCLPDRWQE